MIPPQILGSPSIVNVSSLTSFLYTLSLWAMLSPEILFRGHKVWPMFWNMEVAKGHGAFTGIEILHTRVYHGTLVLPSIRGVPPSAAYN